MNLDIKINSNLNKIQNEFRSQFNLYKTLFTEKVFNLCNIIPYFLELEPGFIYQRTNFKKKKNPRKTETTKFHVTIRLVLSGKLTLKTPKFLV